MPLKLLAMLSAVLLVAACASDPEDTGTVGGGGTAAAAGAGGAGTAAVEPGTIQDFIVNVGDRVFYEFDSSGLTSAARETLDKQAEWLRRVSSATILIEGHCDERGTREYNLALGERRANAAKDYLISRGIGANRIRTISYGKERPAVLGSNEWAWSQNRRAVTVITGGAKS